MDLVLGSQGPPWYGEGLAELLGTHRWETGTLTMSYFPSDKEQTPGWGRIKIVKDELAAGRGMLPAAILNYGPQAHRQNEPYGWCWAFAAFLDGHPAFRDRFRELHRDLRSGDVTGQFRRSFAADADDLGEQWQLFVMNLEYGYDLARAAIVRRPAVSLPPGGTTVTIEADRGWQSSGIRLAAGTEYRFAATGRYQLAETSAVWWCEPGGVTIHYYQGRPLGLLLAAVRDDSRPLDGMSPLLQPQTIGLETQWTPSRDGTLYLRINESPARLGDNQGQLTVRIEAASADRAISVNRRDR